MPRVPPFALTRALFVALLPSVPCLAVDIPQGNPAETSLNRSGDHAGEGVERWAASDPALVIRAHNASGTCEQDLIGPAAQPRWTSRRLFTDTRVFTVPDGEIDLEGWYQQQHQRLHRPGFEQLTYELELGLPWRCQIDLFQVQHKDGRQGSLDSDESGFELDHALATWGVLPGNPTLHGEYAVVGSGYDRLEVDLLLGDTLPARWFWGCNLGFQSDTGGDRAHGYKVSVAIADAVSDALTLGGEGVATYADVAGARDHFSKDLSLGPSVQLRPSERIHLDGEVRWGLTRDSALALYTAIVGCTF